MYSGISGLKNFQTKLDVIGNNISNVNTHGFKKGRVVFKDLISQTTSGASGPTQASGGVNTKQVGLGSQLAAIDTIHGTGALQTTGRTLDVALEGEGFFVVGKYSVDGVEDDGDEDPIFENFEEVRYARAGNFYLDSNGILVDSSGNLVIGYGTPEVNANGIEGTVGHAAMLDPDTGQEDEDLTTFENLYGDAADDDGSTLQPIVGANAGKIWIPEDAQSMAISQDGKVSYVDVTGNLQYAGQLIVAKFANAEGLAKQGGNYYLNTSNSGAPMFGAGTTNGIGKTVSGALEMSNVDLSEEFTEMIVAQRGFQANSRIITTSDEILQELVNLKR